MTILFGWDLNLTLEEGTHLMIKAFMNEQARKYGYSEVTIDQVLELYGHPLSVFYERLFGIEEPLVTQLRKEGEKRSQDLYPLMELTPHAMPVLEWIAEAGHHSVIVSNTSYDEVQRMVDSLNIRHLLKAVHGVTDHPKESINCKVDALRYQMERGEYDRVVMIGDSQQDIDAGNAVGATTYLFQPHCKYHFPYEQGNATHLIADLRDIVRNEVA